MSNKNNVLITNTHSYFLSGNDTSCIILFFVYNVPFPLMELSKISPKYLVLIKFLLCAEFFLLLVGTVLLWSSCCANNLLWREIQNSFFKLSVFCVESCTTYPVLPLTDQYIVKSGICSIKDFTIWRKLKCFSV